MKGIVIWSQYQGKTLTVLDNLIDKFQENKPCKIETNALLQPKTYNATCSNV